ncbi:hypothetical protein DPMN_015428 [Dreissena polymorpha]|uniref:Uncharacterized protein n=1 Tax=Dreissena polymorpha TaxID=45954 RepID=A0A9D4NCS9_DREPO|nr:hypothetical protein DPMN_015428 [Dreissena polymorpha]
MSRKKDPNFLSWESDIGLDHLLGDYTEDEENVNISSVSKSSSSVEKCSDIYLCPECPREYKTVAQGSVVTLQRNMIKT